MKAADREKSREGIDLAKKATLAAHDALYAVPRLGLNEEERIELDALRKVSRWVHTELLVLSGRTRP